MKYLATGVIDALSVLSRWAVDDALRTSTRIKFHPLSARFKVDWSDEGRGAERKINRSLIWNCFFSNVYIPKFHPDIRGRYMKGIVVIFLRRFVEYLLNYREDVLCWWILFDMHRSDLFRMKKDWKKARWRTFFLLYNVSFRFSFWDSNLLMLFWEGKISKEVPKLFSQFIRTSLKKIA